MALGALQGAPVSDGAYERRHNTLRLLLLLHVIAIGGFALATSQLHVLVEVVPLIGLLAVASSRLSIRVRATAAALGLYACSAVIVHLADGQTEAHFHFFVVLALVSLYRDFLPYLVGIGFVLVEHFVVGVLAPTAVFEHSGNTLTWAVIHASFVAAASTAHIASWRSVERVYRDEREVLTAELERLAAVVDSAGIAIFSEDLDGTVLSWNGAAEALFGYHAAELVGGSALGLIPDDRFAELETNLACARAGNSRSYETVRTTKTGAALDVLLVISPVRQGDAVVGASVMARDITVHKAAERDIAAHQNELARRTQELSLLAFRDPLTGLANRALFLDQLDAAHGLRHVRGIPVSVIMLDLDGFKLVNDSAGHAAGDRLLEQVAARILECVRAVDTVARLGGDEFAVLLEGTAEPERVAERILAALAAPHEIGDRWFTATASVGLATCDGGDPASLMRSADVALYAAKAAGKNRLLSYDVQMHGAIVRRTQLAADLRTALAEGHLAPHYQPIVAMQTGEVEGFEALLRWQHPTEGFVSPEEFIPLAEETGLIVPIGTFVLQHATQHAARLSSRAGRAVTVAVNVSVRQLEQTDFLEIVTAGLADSDLPAVQLVLEVTESALADSDAVAVAALHAVRRLGVRVAVDDFGTGYSSLDRLRTLPVDQLKIDRSFISEVGEAVAPPSGGDVTSARTPVLAAIIAMATALELSIVAEGVETQAQFLALQRLGCQLAQGFLMCRPVPLAEAEELLTFSAPYGLLACIGEPHDDAELAQVMRLVQAASRTREGGEQMMSYLLEAACTVTGLETAFVTSVDAEACLQTVRYARNQGTLLVEVGTCLPWESTVCRSALASGRWSSSDAAVDYPTSVAAQAGVKAYCGVPLFSADGAVTATLCAIDSTGRGVDKRGQQFLAFLSRLLTDRDAAPASIEARSVVVVDDSDISRAVITATLSSLRGWRVVAEARTVATAVQICGDLRPDLVLLDVDLPDSGARPAVAQLEAASPGTAVVVVSHSETHRSAALAAGAVAFLTKDRVSTELGVLIAPHRTAPLARKPG